MRHLHFPKAAFFGILFLYKRETATPLSVFSLFLCAKGSLRPHSHPKHSLAPKFFFFFTHGTGSLHPGAALFRFSWRLLYLSPPSLPFPVGVWRPHSHPGCQHRCPRPASYLRQQKQQAFHCADLFKRSLSFWGFSKRDKCDILKST